ncbi:archaellum component FlaG (FlaF/FlaG flagellin family) [Salinibacter ruber]|uniref:PEGA domain-containing protein n=2 Tax=Salinibacter ruber TaxID=146919 RepID=UPI002166FA0A|nr:PEGA domain-containing protein [Salinibacter ruber]MCS3629216.1 archaellum component FlaG (FlaF/FlaG flagellin family) [Salinibacter ruber]MCS4146121.1 archaellum component FlaG (FlaF/FlaG flagellin family) [Salinibacter ruber]
MDLLKSVPAQVGALVVLAFALAPLTSVAQELERHGEVTAIDGQEVTVQLSEDLSVSSGTGGTIYTTTTVGGEERSVRVAQVEVAETDGRMVVVQVENQTESPETGFLVSFEAVQRLGTLAVETQPDDASISVDGETAGTGAVRQEVEAGEHVVVVQADGYQSARRSLTVPPGETRELRFSLEQTGGRLVARATPDSARLLIGGEEVGRGNVSAELPSGEYNLEIQAEGYVSEDTTVAIRSGETTRLSKTLTRETGRIFVAAKPDSARILIDGDLQGRGRTEATLVPGTYDISVRAEGYMPVDTTAIVAAGERALLDVVLERASGQLLVTTEPDSATVMVDGQRVGMAPVSRTLSSGKHQVRATAEGYVSTEKSVTVPEGRRREVALTLEPREGRLVVETDPSGATVRIDGETAGTTPTTSTLVPGEHRVEVEKQGFRSSQKSVQVSQDMRQRIQFSLQRPLNVDVATAHVGPVQDVRARREDSTIVVEYGLDGKEDEYEVSLQLSTDRGASFQDIRGTVEGAVGEEVPPGPRKQVTWVALRDYPQGLPEDRYRLRVNAQAVDGGNTLLWVLGSALAAGAGSTVALLLGGGGGGDGGDGGNGGGGFPTPPAPPN